MVGISADGGGETVLLSGNDAAENGNDVELQFGGNGAEGRRVV